MVRLPEPEWKSHELRSRSTLSSGPQSNQCLAWTVPLLNKHLLDLLFYSQICMVYRGIKNTPTTFWMACTRVPARGPGTCWVTESACEVIRLGCEHSSEQGPNEKSAIQPEG